METRVIIKDFIDVEDDRRPYDYMEKYPREGYVPSNERVKALATGQNKANTIIIANVFDESDFEDEKTDGVEVIDYDKLTKEQLQEALDQKEIEYKANAKKEDLIKLLVGE